MPAKKRGIVFRAFDKIVLVIAVAAVGWAGWQAAGRFADIKVASGYTDVAAREADELDRLLVKDDPDVPIIDIPSLVMVDEWIDVYEYPEPINRGGGGPFRRPQPVFYTARRVGVNRDNVVLSFSAPLLENTVTLDVFQIGADDGLIKDIVHPYEQDYSKVKFRTITYPELKKVPPTITFVGYDSDWAQHRYPVRVDRDVDKTPLPPTEARIVRADATGITIVFAEDPEVKLEKGVNPAEPGARDTRTRTLTLTGKAGLKNVRYVIERRDWVDPLGSWVRICEVDQSGMVRWTHPSGRVGTGGQGEPGQGRDDEFRDENEPYDGPPREDNEDDKYNKYDEDDEDDEGDEDDEEEKPSLLWWRDELGMRSEDTRYRGYDFEEDGDSEEERSVTTEPSMALQRGASYSYRVRISAENTFPEVSETFAATEIANMPVGLDAQILRMKPGPPGVPVRVKVKVAKRDGSRTPYGDFEASVGDMLGAVVQRGEDLPVVELATGWTILACHPRVPRKIDKLSYSDDRIVCGDEMGRLYVIWRRTSLTDIIPKLVGDDIEREPGRDPEGRANERRRYEERLREEAQRREEERRRR
jgi:hypothetical protein